MSAWRTSCSKPVHTRGLETTSTHWEPLVSRWRGSAGWLFCSLKQEGPSTRRRSAGSSAHRLSADHLPPLTLQASLHEALPLKSLGYLTTGGLLREPKGQKGLRGPCPRGHTASPPLHPALSADTGPRRFSSQGRRNGFHLLAQKGLCDGRARWAIFGNSPFQEPA